jgi:hypothetical protein
MIMEKILPYHTASMKVTSYNNKQGKGKATLHTNYIFRTRKYECIHDTFFFFFFWTLSIM